MLYKQLQFTTGWFGRLMFKFDSKIDIRFDDVLEDDERVTCVSVMNKEVATLADEIPHQEYRCFFHLAWAGTSGPARADYAVQLNNVKLACDYIKLWKYTIKKMSTQSAGMVFQNDFQSFCLIFLCKHCRKSFETVFSF